MVVLPADHHIEDPEAFNEFLKAAIEKARSEKALVTIGIKPNRPETGYGYIHGDDEAEERFNEKVVHPVHGFKEKPDAETAQKFLDSGDYFWNSGMFIWSAKTILREFEAYLPEMYDQVKAAGEDLYTDTHKEAIHDFYMACTSVSIDYGIMEQAENVYVVPGEFGWNDVGSWVAVYELGDKSDNGNVIKSDFATFSEAGKNYVFSESGKMISVVGLDGVAVVETEDAILVCKLDKAQNVKEIVQQLKEKEELNKFL